MVNSSNLFHVEFFVYIGGVRVPESRIDIASSFNAFPVCTVTMPPDINLVGIGRRDRIPMQVFMSDTLREPAGDSTTYESAQLMLFDGEVTGYSYQSSEMGKELTVTAEAIPAFLRDVYVRILTSFDDIMMSHSAANQASIDANPQLMYFPASLFLGGISGDSSERIKHPYQFLENATQFLTGEKSPDSSPRSPLLKFYGDYCTQLGMPDRFTKVPLFDTGYFGEEGFPILKGLGQEALLAIFEGMAGQAPVQESIYNMINYIVSSMEFEWAVFMSPAFIRGKMVSTCLKPIFYEALPPACNYLFKSMIKSINVQEKVASVPTRIMMRDIHSAKARYFGQSGPEAPGGLAALNYSFWPVGGDPDAVAEGFSKLTSELIQDPQDRSEVFCGPRIFETTAPPWMSFLAKGGVTEDVQRVALNVFKHIYYLKQYEHRNMSVSSAFNPYVTVGFPAVVYDVDTPGREAAEGDGFIGQVTAVHHVITKQTVSTDIQLGFTRTLKEEAETGGIPATLEEVTEVVQDASNMQNIYDGLIEPNHTVRTIAELRGATTFGEGRNSPQENPVAAYEQISRNILTRGQYLSFMEASLDDDGNIVGGRSTENRGSYFTSRWDSTVIDSLKTAVSNAQTIRNVFA